MKKLAFPIGNPPVELSEADRINFINRLAADIEIISTEFSPYSVRRRYKISMPNDKKLYAIWSGYMQSSIDDSIVISLPPSEFFIVDKGQYFKEIPFPVHVRYGPIASQLDLPVEVTEGEEIGTLVGEELFIEFIDNYGYNLDPYFFFRFFQESDFLNIPVGSTNPFAPTTSNDNILNIAYSIDGQDNTQSYLKLSGDTRGHIIYNPNVDLQPKHFSFLSLDEILVEILNSTSKGNIKITDISAAMYKTKQTPKFVEKKEVNTFSFKPNRELRPHHLSYKTANGKRKPGKPLKYRITATIGDTILSTEIEQDKKDIIRQEYKFHSNPYQTFKLDIPDRSKIEFNNKGSLHFTPKEIQKSNYNTRLNNWLLNSTEAFHVAEYIRWKFREHVRAKRIAGENQYSRILTFDLKINSSWRNPERNEAVKGAKKSNHQFGRALDLKSIHRKKSTNNNQKNADMQVALFEAGKVFLEDLIATNTAADCTSVEILLEKNSVLLWSYKVDKNTGAILSIKSLKGKNTAGEHIADYDTVVTDVTPNKSEIWNAAKYSTHVHIGWKSSEGHSVALNLPELPGEDILNDYSTEPEYRNLILIASEDSTVKVDDQLPLHHVADSITAYLQEKTGFPTEIREVASAIDFLNAINAFGMENYKIKYFFSFGHSWDGGLVLKNYKNYATLSDDPETRAKQKWKFYEENIHQQEIIDELNYRYGFTESSDLGLDTIPFDSGTNDYQQTKSHLLNISHFLKMPQWILDNIQQCFEDSEGVYLVGCNTDDVSNELAKEKSTIARIFANAIQKPVYGAGYYSYVHQADIDLIDKPAIAPSWDTPANPGHFWRSANLNRTEPLILDKLFILIPGKQIRNLKKDFGNDYDFDIPEIPRTSNLLEVYQTMLNKTYPLDGAGDKEVLNEIFQKEMAVVD